MSSPKKQWRLNTRTLFLTYPKCSLSVEEARDLLLEKLEGPTVQDWCIAREEHQDGTPHLHCYLKLSRKVNIKDPSKLDLKEFHGNYQGCRSPKCVLKYVTKGGKYISNMGEVEEHLKKMENQSLYVQVHQLAKEGKGAEAVNLLANHPKGARDLLLYGDLIQKSMAKLKKAKSPQINFKLEDFSLDWTWDVTKTLVLTGKTNLGKTTLSHCLIQEVSKLPALLIRHMDRVKEYDSNLWGGIIFDDMSFKHLHREAQIALTDTAFDTDIHVRYSVATLPRETPRIITTNLDPYLILDLYDEAIRRRCQLVEVSKNNGVFSYKNIQ